MNCERMPDKPPICGTLFVIISNGLNPNALPAMLATLAIVPILPIISPFFIPDTILAAYIRTLNCGTFLNVSYAY